MCGRMGNRSRSSLAFIKIKNAVQMFDVEKHAARKRRSELACALRVNRASEKRGRLRPLCETLRESRVCRVRNEI